MNTLYACLLAFGLATVFRFNGTLSPSEWFASVYFIGFVGLATFALWWLGKPPAQYSGPPDAG